MVPWQLWIAIGRLGLHVLLDSSFWPEHGCVAALPVQHGHLWAPIFVTIMIYPTHGHANALVRRILCDVRLRGQAPWWLLQSRATVGCLRLPAGMPVKWHALPLQARPQEIESPNSGCSTAICRHCPLSVSLVAWQGGVWFMVNLETLAQWA